MKISKIIDKKNKREIGNLKSLKKSIQEIGLLNPLTINQNNKLLAGQRRFQAIQELGWEKVPVRILQSENELFNFRVSLAENIQRKNLSEPEEAIAIKEYDEMKRKVEGEKDTRLKGKDKFGRPTLASEQGWTQDKTASDLNVPRRTISRAIQIAIAIEEKPELAKEKKGNVILRKYKAIKDSEAIKNKTFPIIKGKFKTILIDPPWNYQNDFGGLSIDGRAMPEYKTESKEKLRALGIGKYAEKNCHLYLWSTNNYIPIALELGQLWGFSYKTLLTWIKPSIGMGAYFRNSTEQLLFFVKGHLSTRAKDIPTYFEAPRGKHSEKPEISYQIIEKSSYPSYLEYFGRKERIGWTSYGKF